MVGFDEIVLIAVAALLLFGPDKLPQYLRELGRFYAEIRKAQREIERELSMDALVSSPAARAPSPQVMEIAKKMGIDGTGKTEEQLLAAIEAGLPADAKTQSQEEPADVNRRSPPEAPANDAVTQQLNE